MDQPKEAIWAGSRCLVLSGCFGSAFGAYAMDGHIGPADLGTSRHLPEMARIERNGLGVCVTHLAADVTVKVDVLVKIGAVSRLGPLHMHLLDETARRQVIQTIVNGGQGDARRPTFHAMKHIISRGVIVGLDQDLENLAPVWREPHISPQYSQTAIQSGRLRRYARMMGWHGGARRHRIRTRIILINV